jgi:hypothetical protein
VLSLLCHLFFFANTLLKVLHEMFVWFLPLVAWSQHCIRKLGVKLKFYLIRGKTEFWRG